MTKLVPVCIGELILFVFVLVLSQQQKRGQSMRNSVTQLIGKAFSGRLTQSPFEPGDGQQRSRRT